MGIAHTGSWPHQVQDRDAQAPTTGLCDLQADWEGARRILQQSLAPVQDGPQGEMQAEDRLAGPQAGPGAH